MKAVLGQLLLFYEGDLEVVGLPKSLSNHEVEGKVCDDFGKLGCDIAKYDLDACHRRKDKERLIVTFYIQKVCEEVPRTYHG